MKNLVFISFLFSISIVFSQKISGSELLDKAIQYHDPNNNWKTFNNTLNVTMKTPNNPKRVSVIDIDLPEESFNVIAQRDTISSRYTIKKGKCIIAPADSLRIASLKEKPKRSHCETAALYKNYYTYLYGLPMKLKDKGTIIDEKVELKSFKGKKYLVLKATYEATVGSDIWYFYFNRKTYAMEIYQFYKTDDKGNIKKDSGEYILLSGESIISTIKMPKNRAWYYNKNDGYLGTDFLMD
ncbi:DUF6503 family protein [uncultured Lacinutrix sp.]|uniref:DUF6503 family protein n=1 Tax=uncultured Lacinutrix sp. TaxID=574032 RepID=UPI00260A8418|nr:DUF6503 family protein [uncultured Lacinutrix sp.]